MGLVSGVVVYLMIWWTLLFAILPWGNRAPTEEEAVEGQAMGAPVKPSLKKKFIVNTVLSGVLWLVIVYLIDIKIIDFHSLARDMSQAGPQSVEF